MQNGNRVTSTKPAMAIAEADAFVSRVTDGRMRIVTGDDSILLICLTTLEAAGLLPFQLSEEGIREALVDWDSGSDV